MSTNPNPSPASAPAAASGAAVVLLWVTRLLAAGALGYASYLKMTDNPHDVALFQELKMEPIGRYLIGALEGLAALALLVPQSTVYGALLGLSVMLGAIIGHLTALGMDGIQNALVVAACCVIVLFLRRHDAPFLDNLLDR